MRGIILAGGSGLRLRPTSLAVPKALHAVYDKPLIWYPFETLINAGIQEILVITGEGDYSRQVEKALTSHPSYKFNSVGYAVQWKPKGIADAFNVARYYNMDVADDPIALILGDNIFHGELNFARDVNMFDKGALIYGVPQSQRMLRASGVIEISSEGQVLSIEEKPSEPKSDLVVPGLYLYDSKVFNIAKNLLPSDRGELEITDVNLAYLKAGELRANRLDKVTWFDCGNHDDLLEASLFMQKVKHS